MSNRDAIVVVQRLLDYQNLEPTKMTGRSSYISSHQYPNQPIFA